MFLWFVEDPTSVCTILGIVALGLAIFWYMNQHPRILYALGAVLGLILVELLVAFLVDTDGKRIGRVLNDIVDGTNARDVSRVFSHLSEEFLVEGTDKRTFRARVEGYIVQGRGEHFIVWDYAPREISREKRAATVIFKVKGVGGDARGVEFYNCRTEFVLDPDNQWRVKTFQLFLPMIDPMKGSPVALPF